MCSCTQALSTAKMGPEASDKDLLTGFHLIDGKERLIVVEGRADGAMAIVKVGCRVRL